MSVKIRLTRIGRHKDPFYRIVVADSRSSRDGRYIEQIGIFNPDLGEEKAEINEELAMKWLKNGAAPSESVRAMFSRKGIMEKFASSKVKKVAPKATAKKAPAKKTAAKKEEASKESK